ncbi:MAG: histidine--tRNA ligase [Promethearchaeota archaeon]
MVKLRNLKGTDDRKIEQCLILNEILAIITNYFEKYGFNPIETPTIEFNEILSSKYAGGTEILKEMYTLTDNGKRDLALRYDLTVPLCRYIGINERELKFPFKRYEIGKIFRDGPIKLGRLREFYQCDADVVGSDELFYDAECLAIISSVLKQLGKDFFIELNNRKLLNGIIEDAGIKDKELASSIILSIDKAKKIGIKGVEKELIEKGIKPSTFESILKNIYKSAEFEDNESLLNFYKNNISNKLALEGISELITILNYCDKMGIADKVVFRPELARGLEIYTGPIFEAFFKTSRVKSSIAGGGRYDKIIGNFLNKDRAIPAVGFSFGLEPIISDILMDPQNYPKIKKRKTSVEVMIIPIKIEIIEVLPIIRKLRESGIKCDIFTKNKSIRDALGIANFFEIPVTVMIGEKELTSGNITVKDMKNEQQFSVKASEISLKIKQLLNIAP